MWTYAHNEILDEYVLISPADRIVGSVLEKADAASICELLNEALKARAK